MQCASTLLMVRPATFGFNTETAANNYFQDKQLAGKQLNDAAVKEFDNMVAMLRDQEIEVIVAEDTAHPLKPDALFPNNWISCRKDQISIFPMYAQNRRIEKRKEIIALVNPNGNITQKDYSHYEAENMFLEGTGSMVCDHQHKIIYACLSERTHQLLLEEFANDTGYKIIAFNADDDHGREIYHTNVMMAIGEHFAVLCADAISSHNEKRLVIDTLETTGHELVLISHQQMNAFAGNMLQVTSKAGAPYILMSETAAISLNVTQMRQLKKYATPIIIPIRTIEKAGGGSVRCMVAEVFR